MSQAMEWTDSDKQQLNRKLDTIIALLGAGDKEDRRVRVLTGLGYSFQEISGMTGIPEGTLKTRFSANS